MNDVPLIRKTDVNDINTSLIAIKKQLKQLNEAVGLIDVPDVDLTPFVRKDEVVNVIEAGNMNPVTSNAVVPTNEVLSGDTRAVTSGAVSEALSYSTEEVFTGSYWIDGKPIYRKVIEFGNYPSAGQTKTVNHNISNLDKVLNIGGYSFGNTYEKFPFTKPNGITECWINTTSISVFVQSGLSITNTIAVITLEYTKTTDTATRSIPTERSVEEPEEETR